MNHEHHEAMKSYEPLLFDTATLHHPVKSFLGCDCETLQCILPSSVLLVDRSQNIEAAIAESQLPDQLQQNSRSASFRVFQISWTQESQEHQLSALANLLISECVGTRMSWGNLTLHTLRPLPMQVARPFPSGHQLSSLKIPLNSLLHHYPSYHSHKSGRQLSDTPKSGYPLVI